jgi:hypothetical protein
MVLAHLSGLTSSLLNGLVWSLSDVVGVDPALLHEFREEGAVNDWSTVIAHDPMLGREHEV